MSGNQIPGRLPPKIPGSSSQQRQSPKSPLPTIPGGSSRVANDARRVPSGPQGSSTGHILVKISVSALGAIFLLSMLLTPYSELFRATSLKSILIGLIAFFASTVFHALYTFDEDASKSDGTFNEWKFVSRNLVEKGLLLGCWLVGVVNLASMMTEIARSFQ
jgi:hypothetical protein